MIAIKDLNEKTRAEIEINEGSIRKAELMKEDFIKLCFSLCEPVQFEIGDHVAIEQGEQTEKYELTAPASPTYNINTGGYDYELQLDAHYIKFKNKTLKFQPSVPGGETSWTLTGKLTDFASIIEKNIKHYGFKYSGKDYQVKMADEGIDNADEMITLSFDGVSILDALTNIAQAFNSGTGCDWWVEGNIIYFGKCESGTRLTLALHSNVESIQRSESESEYATRLFAFGSTENIPMSYRKDLMFDIDAKSGTKFTDKTRPLTIDMFNEDLITRDSSFKTLLQISEYGVSAQNDISGNTIIVEGEAVAAALTNYQFLYGKYAIEQAEGSNKSMRVYFGKFKEGVVKGNINARIYLQYQKNEQSKKVLVAEGSATFEKELTASTDEETGATLYSGVVTFEPGFTPKKAWIDTTTNATLKIEARIEIDTDTDLEASIITGFQFASAPNRFNLLNYAAPFTAYIETVYWKSWAYVGKHKVKVTQQFFANSTTQWTWIQPINEDGTTKSIAANEGDTFMFSQNAAGQDYLIRGKVPYSYFTPRFSQQNGVVTSRLMLPEFDLYQDVEGNITRTTTSNKIYDGKGYIDAVKNLPAEQIVESIKYFDDIKPTYAGTIGSIGVRTEEEKDTNGDATGNSIYNYVFLETLLKNFSNAYAMGEGNMKITFSSGKCAGLTFEIEKFSGKLDSGLKANGTSDQGTWFRIVPNDNYAVTLPNQFTYPETGDKYNVSGYDTSLIDSTLLSLAEIELYKRAKNHLDNMSLDKHTDTLTLMSHKVIDYYTGEEQAMKYNEDKYAYFYQQQKTLFEGTTEWEKVYYLGRRVHLEGEAYYGTAGKDTRILGFEYPLDIPYDSPKLTCGETAAYSRIRELEKSIK